MQRYGPLNHHTLTQTLTVDSHHIIATDRKFSDTTPRLQGQEVGKKLPHIVFLHLNPTNFILDCSKETYRMSDQTLTPVALNFEL